jgi:hypothetical protein
VSAECYIRKPQRQQLAHPAAGQQVRCVPFAGQIRARRSRWRPTPIRLCRPTSLGSWMRDSQIIFVVVNSSLFCVSASDGAPSPFATLDRSRAEGQHLWPQALPRGRLLFWVQSDKPENTGVYAASLAKPNERVHLLTTDSKALYATGGDVKDYLCVATCRHACGAGVRYGGTPAYGEVRILADLVASFGGGVINAAVSGNILLYSDAGSVSEFAWFDRAGKPLGVVGEPSEYGTIRFSPDGRRLVTSRANQEAETSGFLDADGGVASRFTSAPGVIRGYSVWSPAWPPDYLYLRPATGTFEAHRPKDPWCPAPLGVPSPLGARCASGCTKQVRSADWNPNHSVPHQREAIHKI